METATRPPIPKQPGGPLVPPARAHSGIAPLSRWRAFDALQLVRPGRVLLVDVGGRTASDLLMSLLAGTVAQGHDAVVVDGGNWLDVYDLGDAARAHGLRKESVLTSVRVARGFTAYQLQTLIEDALPAQLEEGHVGLALVSCMPEMYLDEDLDPNEARVLVTRALRTLRETARKHDVPILVSNSTLAPHQRHRLRSAFDTGVDHATTLLPAPHGGLRILVRGKPLATLAANPRARQRKLAEFEARPDVPEDAFYRRAIDTRIRHAPKHAGELRFKMRETSNQTLQRVFATEGA